LKKNFRNQERKESSHMRRDEGSHEMKTDRQKNERKKNQSEE
jgi:hypothetical protein